MSENMQFDLKRFRKEYGLSQEALAVYLGVGQSFISKIERGDSPLPESLMEKILSNPEWDVKIDAGEHHNVMEGSVGGDNIQQYGNGNIGKASNMVSAEILALYKEIEMLRAQNEELRAEKAAYWEMIVGLTKKK